jgi:hypothetical protein
VPARRKLPLRPVELAPGGGYPCAKAFQAVGIPIAPDNHSTSCEIVRIHSVANRWKEYSIAHEIHDVANTVEAGLHHGCDEKTEGQPLQARASVRKKKIRGGAS